MSAITGLPTRGSDVTVLVDRVHLHPLSVLVEFWGKFSLQRTTDYQILADEIQSHGALFKDLEGNPGDQCLVQIDATWYRARIVSKNGSKYDVFLIDRGKMCTATTSKLAWGKKEHFQLPREVEFCILANVLPLASDNRWSPMALEFLKSFSGKLVHAHVQDVLVPERMFLLNIPCISKQMYELGFAKKLSPVAFHNFLVMSLKSLNGAEVSTGVQQLHAGSGEPLRKQELFIYPELSGGTVETVIVTEVTNPQQIFCQLKVFSHELKKLTERVTQSCEGKGSSCVISSDMIGYPCAARGTGGKWYRSVIQQVFQTNKVVEVLHVDFGTKQFVQMENVRPLAAEFLRMPVVTYTCSLHGLLDKRTGWTTSEIDFLRSVLLHKSVIAKFEYQSITEEVYYVTLYGDDNINLNTLFGSKEISFVRYEKPPGHCALPSLAYSHQQPVQPERKLLPSQQTVEEKEQTTLSDKPPAEELALNSSHLAVVQHVSNPSEFWIQTENYRKDLEELLDRIYQLYRDSGKTHAVKYPAPGLYCAAQAQDGEFYRATVTEVGETQVTVFFVDYGNTEVVEKSKIRTLPPEFKKTPQLGLKCSLAGVRPKDGKWSQHASEYFTEAVADKQLKVHVKEKYRDCYVVQLTDPGVQGEQDVATQMCNNRLAERTENPRPALVRGAGKPSSIPPAQLADAGLPEVRKQSGLSFKSMIGLHNAETRVATFKEQMFPIGSVLDVNVSYIESPNDFWCQLVQKAGPLRSLMYDMQAYYAASEFEPNVDAACVARHPDNGMWYRTLVIRKLESAQVIVLFVDYGQTMTVSLFDLRKICPAFLTLHGQAFRCSLLNHINPTSPINEWNHKATEMFQNFVKSADSNFVILKCTIYAVTYSEQMVLRNIVDLETPFESICTSMADLVTSVPSKMPSGASLRLDTYYYSTHNIKVGTEEQVTVSWVSNVSEFYCHLDRNADVMKDLTVKVNALCQQLEKAKVPTVFGALCFARYTDGQWYRAQIKATKPELLVHFVDYGDTVQVDASDLLPVPKEASDIMSVPVQAVLCALSDVPPDVPVKANEWFEKTATECQFRALIVAKEADGKLLVELYHGHTQVNAKIKKTFQIEMQEEQVIYQSWKPSEAPASHAPKRTLPNRATDSKLYEQVPRKNFPITKPSSQIKTGGNFADENLRPAKTPPGQQSRLPPRELYRPPHQRQPNRTATKDGASEANAGLEPTTVSPPPEAEQFIPESPGTKSQQGNAAEKLPKLSDLPSRCIAPGSAADVYVSHCDGPLSFCVQRVDEEDAMFSLAEKLNDPSSTPEASINGDVQPGDLVKAEFADDLSWYRAVVKETSEDATALVEFIDFGNTATVAASKLERLPQSLLLLPVYSTRCRLRGAALLGEEKALDPHAASAFKEDAGSGGDKVLKCRFIERVGSVWEVGLEENGVDLWCKVSPESRNIAGERLATEEFIEVESERPPVRPCTPGYAHQKEVLEGQKLEVYISTINEDQTFWCQPADSQELCKITSAVSEVGNAADARIHPDGLLPGTPCVALFADDQLWYRAEVVDKNEDELSVLFVDYGNMSQVGVTDVRAVPPALLEVPPQAFLCELEGFNSLRGRWTDGAADELSTLTADKLLQLTVAAVSTTGGRLKCVVELECEGQAISAAMRAYWEAFTTAEAPDAGASIGSPEPPQQLDSTRAMLELHDKPDVRGASDAACTASPGGYSEERGAEELSASPAEHQVLKLVGSPKRSECSDDPNAEESLLESAEEERDSSEGATAVPEDMLSSDGGIDEASQLSVDLKDDQDTLSQNTMEVAGQDGEEEEASVLHAEEPEDDSDPMDDAAEEEEEEDLETGAGDGGEFFTSTHSLDMDPADAPAVVTDERDVASVHPDPMTRPSDANMLSVDLSAVTELQENVLKEGTDSSKQTEPVPSSPTVLIPLCEQETEAGEGSLQEGRTQVKETTQKQEADVAGEEAAPAHPADTQPALLQHPAADRSEEHHSTVPSAETDEDPDDGPCSLAETRPADPEEPSRHEEMSAGTDGLSDGTAEERLPRIAESSNMAAVSEGDVAPLIKDVRERMVPAEESDMVQEESGEGPAGSTAGRAGVPLQGEAPRTPGPDTAVESSRPDILPLVRDASLTRHCDPVFQDGSTLEDETFTSEVLPADVEPHICTDVRNSFEELRRFAFEIRLEDVSQDSEQEAEMNADCTSEQTSSPLNKFDDPALSEESSLSAEDSFEAQLSKITHLSLIIYDGAADAELAEQQPEE
ncbi:tudor domain-containing 6 [Fundulus heteroclitus]|uniref:tudor domain-containing 6 n=1 Tax=Fundulus heteroclitus TaxID=8078 RepID=UPI00165CA02B|nr:tudor domain-containing 6 [Fundulus heteroclitus]